MKPIALAAPLFVLLAAGCAAPSVGDAPTGSARGLQAIDTVVVIYAENRAFDTLYGLFPGANGIPGVNPSSDGVSHPQRDFDGRVLPVLPPVWGGLTAGGERVTLTQAQSAGLPNRPFQIDDPAGLNGSGVVVGQAVITRDLVHRYYSNLLQINGGRNDQFAAYSDAGGLSMGYYDGSRMKLWALARQYTLADHFFMGAFGGSYLNHQYLVCACVPVYPDADAPGSPARNSITQIETDAGGRFVRFVPAANMPGSALDGRPRYQRDSTLAPKDADGLFRTVNTMQPAYQPSSMAPAPSGDARYADPSKASTLPPQTQATIGDLLDAKGIGWAWYAGAWDKVNAGHAGSPQAHLRRAGAVPAASPALQLLRRVRPGRACRGTRRAPEGFRRELPAGRGGRHAAARHVLQAARQPEPARELREPQRRRRPHRRGDREAAAEPAVAAHADHRDLRRERRLLRPRHGAARRPLGPGTRIPALIVSPYAKRGFVDKTPYDTGSILRFITRRWSLPTLPGIALRDAALRANGEPPMGDLSAALDLP